MNIKLFSLIFCIFNLVLLADEVSVFGAGNLESVNPYGLTSSEKVILKNKNKLKKFDRKIDDTRSNIELLNERIDGIESIFDGDSRKLNTTVNKLSTHIMQYKSDKELVKELIKVQKQNIENINNLEVESKKLQETINSLIIQIDKEYVTKKQFNGLVTFVNKHIDKEYVTKKQFDELVTFINKQVSKSSKKIEPIKKKKFTKSKKKLLEDARKLFKKDYFTQAIPIFEYLVESNYRPAESNFYLGEMWFHRKKYKDAIHHYKTSMVLYDKAKYIPKLLLHSAISFEKTKDLNNASNFYGTLIDVYPDTKEAKKAQKYLANIN